MGLRNSSYSETPPQVSKHLALSLTFDDQFFAEQKSPRRQWRYSESLAEVTRCWASPFTFGIQICGGVGGSILKKSNYSFPDVRRGRLYSLFKYVGAGSSYSENRATQNRYLNLRNVMHRPFHSAFKYVGVEVPMRKIELLRTVTRICETSGVVAHIRRPILWGGSPHAESRAALNCQPDLRAIGNCRSHTTSNSLGDRSLHTDNQSTPNHWPKLRNTGPRHSDSGFKYVVEWGPHSRNQLTPNRSPNLRDVRRGRSYLAFKYVRGVEVLTWKIEQH